MYVLGSGQGEGKRKKEKKTKRQKKKDCLDKTLRVSNWAHGKLQAAAQDSYIVEGYF